MSAPAFAELIAASNYSFLRGASHPAEMVARAVKLEMAGLGIADRNSVAGVVRAHKAWKDLGRESCGLKLVVGARLVFADETPDIIAYPATRHGWGRLTRLLTLGNRRAEKGDCILRLPDLLDHAEDLLLIATGQDRGVLERLQEARPGAVWLAAHMLRGGADARRLAAAQALSAATGVPLLASNDALYDSPQARPLHDILTCIREGVTIQSAGRRLAINAERHLKSPAEMARLFRACPVAVEASMDLLSRVQFRLDELHYEYPHEPVPDGWQPQGWLEHLVMRGIKNHFANGLPKKYFTVLQEEFSLIRSRNYAPYFLTVHDIVHHARSLDPPILCQGRGSAANSLVCYFLGITPIDPVREKLLFSRFLSEARNEPPDIDVDFEHERREEVMQYIYARYGRDRAGIAATVIHYRPRSTIREVGKALGMSEDVTARLSSTIWGSWGGDVPQARVEQAGFDPANPVIARMKNLVDQLLEFPRHLSQHVGGFVLSQGRLDEMVPIHNAAMPDRTFIEWDKDDIEELGLMKVDVLALGMLTCIRKSFDLLRQHGLGDFSLRNVPLEDPGVYQMLSKGDSIGTFQVESRAQIAMLPRMRPRKLYDLVIQVAIVRPGPIQGGMVHPYLRRRTGEEKATLPSPGPGYPQKELEEVLAKTEGVPLFQEQAMKLAIVAAAFTPAEADGLRRAMAAFRHKGTVDRYKERLVGGMMARGYDPEFAERCFKQIEGFGDYGFPESHAQAFAWLAYVSSWLKCWHPAAFTCALLNSQPMGFYAPAQLIRDALEHAVVVRRIDVSHSAWDCTLEEGGLVLRLGFSRLDGFRREWADAIADGRDHGPYQSVEDMALRAALPPAALRKLADADALKSLGHSRRSGLWEVRRKPPAQLPLFAHAGAPELGRETDTPLPKMPKQEEIVADYQTLRYSLKGHPMQFLRDAFKQEGVSPCSHTLDRADGRKIRVAGVVLTRQRPGKGNAVFITIEDETGIANGLLWARDLEKQRSAVMAARLMLIEGVIQRSKEGVVHVMIDRVIDRTAMLAGLSGMTGGETHRPSAHRHPRNVRILPKSRDFH
ncbi:MULTISPECIES: error-prone DNA polymerase [unclassified Novosphingobium]|uniref:error-prone DNA polymerase n=1 Tax=unclassified Novosphingobium TaxID=2644732 RepID=UPI00086EEA93|nr:MULTISPECIES: error-prone DNA polymerase [unclassified Novosphingobium]MBN9143388.1 error-prone DNA polymerase [Novosphingobium sp.]MDR6706636.1 error-prone DNA polymerase [Novosphingobium sp. 1748]ODU83818.1 MAG: error-prone DNA polymerase [Novosphingobium sp. SCN 63-17]OJX92598.1 MAG: error-prone DNA polymerase [Novosphingobium sp. 63-713]